MIYEMAKKYYPTKWNRAMIDRLFSAGKLTQEEYEDIMGAQNKDFVDV